MIESFNGQQVHDFNSLRNRVADAGPGSTADVVVTRDGSEKHLSVKLDEATASKATRERDSEPSASDDKTSLGVAVAPLTPELAERAHASKDARGLVVEDVNPNGRAADAGIQAGDVIQEVNRQPVKSVDDLKAALKKSSEQTDAAADSAERQRHLRHGEAGERLAAYLPKSSPRGCSGSM